MKRLFQSAKLPMVKWVTFLRGEWEKSPKKIRARVEAALKYPVFVKPANLGSSVGISKAHDAKELGPAIELAAGFDRKIVVEQGVGGKGKARELEVAVLGNDEPEASVVGEVIPGKEFYDYEAKYLSEGSDLIVPAKLTKEADEAGAGDGGCGVQGVRLRGTGAGGFSDGAGEGWIRESRTDLCERDQHAAWVYVDQHVSAAVGGFGGCVSAADRSADCARNGTARGQGPEQIQPVACSWKLGAKSEPTASGGVRRGELLRDARCQNKRSGVGGFGSAILRG